MSNINNLFIAERSSTNRVKKQQKKQGEKAHPAF